MSHRRCRALVVCARPDNGIVVQVRRLAGSGTADKLVFKVFACGLKMCVKFVIIVGITITAAAICNLVDVFY